MTMILNNPEIQVRDLEWYKSRYNGLRDDVINQKCEIEHLKLEAKSYEKHIEVLQGQLDSAKDHIDVLWDTLSELRPNGKTRIEHEE